MAIHYAQGYTPNLEGGANLASFQGNLEELIRCLANRQRAVTGKSTTVADPDVSLATLATSRGSFAAAKATAQNDITNNTATKVTYGTELWDVNGWYDPTNSRYTAGTAGKFVFGGAVLISAPVADHRGTFMLYKNGAAYRFLALAHTSHTGNMVIAGATNAVAAVNDYFELFFQHDFGVNTPDLDGLGETLSTFWGYYHGT